jgi:catenin alpha
LRSNAARQMNWNDPENFEIKTLSVERQLEQLVKQVTTLVDGKPSNYRKGQSKSGQALLDALDKSIDSFMAVGQEVAIIAQKYGNLSADFGEMLKEVATSGSHLSAASAEFVRDPFDTKKREKVIRQARAVLSAVTRLLVLADMIDVERLLEKLKLARASLNKVKNSADQNQLNLAFKEFGGDVATLQQAAGLRQKDLKDPLRRDELAAARKDLKDNSLMLYTASQAALQHPEVAAAKQNKDFVLGRVQDAMQRIERAITGTGPMSAREMKHPNLDACFDEFEDKIEMSPLKFEERVVRPSLEDKLEGIIYGAAIMADSQSTRDDRKERIVQEANNVRQALQDLLNEYSNSAGNPVKSAMLESAIDAMISKNKDLKRQLRKAVVDHVSDCYIQTTMPLLVLIEAAKNGNEEDVKEYAHVFREHAEKLVEVANLATEMSNNDEGIRMVKMATGQIENLCPQVINAALTLAARSDSEVAQENMEAFRRKWENEVQNLTDSVDEIVTIHDFLAVSEAHILEDVTQCVGALQAKEGESLDQSAGSIQGRVQRVHDVVMADMDNYEPDWYTDKVREEADKLLKEITPIFVQRVGTAIETLQNGDETGEVDQNDFIEAARMVYEGVRDVRRAVLQMRDPNDIDDVDSDIVPSHVSEQQSTNTLQNTDRVPFKDLPEDAKETITANISEFNEQRAMLDREVGKWDESSNDIIVLAKKMCMIMMQMTDFTRGTGPLKNTSDVIESARSIARLGNDLESLASQISEACPEDWARNELSAHINKIRFYCHQLNMCAKVKAEVQNIAGELVVSGLDSATSLIQAAKNLMNAVVSTVKSSYVASTKFKNRTTQNNVVVMWRLKAPEKKPLVRRSDDARRPVRRASQKKTNPNLEMSNYEQKL